MQLFNLKNFGVFFLGFCLILSCASMFGCRYDFLLGEVGYDNHEKKCEGDSKKEVLEKIGESGESKNSEKDTKKSNNLLNEQDPVDVWVNNICLNVCLDDNGYVIDRSFGCLCVTLEQYKHILKEEKLRECKKTEKVKVEN